MVHIGRLNTVGRAKETTKGTPVTVTKLISATEVSFRPLAIKVDDTGSLWSIDAITGKDLAQQKTEISIAWWLKPNRTLELFEASLWTSSVAWSDPYTHTFTLAQNNEHPAYTILHKNPSIDERATYCMLNEFAISVTNQQHVLYTSSWIWGAISTTSSSATYDPEENFLSRKCQVEIDDSVSFASPVVLDLRSFNLTFSKNLLEDYVLNKVQVADLYNQAFAVSGDMELTYKTTSLRGLSYNNTKKSIRITIVGDEEIGTGEFNTIVITLWSVTLDDWDHSTGNDDITTQTLWFVKELWNPTNISLTVKNTRASL